MASSKTSAQRVVLHPAHLLCSIRIPSRLRTICSNSCLLSRIFLHLFSSVSVICHFFLQLAVDSASLHCVLHAYFQPASGVQTNWHRSLTQKQHTCEEDRTNDNEATVSMWTAMTNGGHLRDQC